ncbi:MAG: TIGR03808 family TAT-translocated repetitive protein [Rhizobiaceae bacterium]
MQRRDFLTYLGFGLGISTLPAQASAELLQNTSMRGAIDAGDFGIIPDVYDDQSRAFSQILERASADNQEIFLPPGNYVLSNIRLPKRIRIRGVQGASRITYGGGGVLFSAADSEVVELKGVTFDGANSDLGEGSLALIEARRVPRIVIDDCEIIGSVKHGVMLEGCAGRIERSSISGAGQSGIYSVEGTGVSISGNTVRDCANGGILVHRWQDGEDKSIVSGNRVERIGARDGGTGQNGNGINVFRARNVQVSGNQISDCAFSAIRFNSASDAQIMGNNCLRSGETGIYAEFAFEGAIIANNVVDGAANGISVVNFNEGGRLSTISGNIVRNLKKEGPYPAEGLGFGNGINVEAESAVTGNIVENAAAIGITMGWGPYMRNLTVTGNIIRNAKEGIGVSVVEGVGKAVITGNVFDKIKTGAIFGREWAKVVTGDMAKHGNQGFKTLTVERNEAS